MSIDQVSDAHLFDDANQEGDTIDLFRMEDHRRRRGLLRYACWGDDKTHGLCDHLMKGVTTYTRALTAGYRLTILSHHV
jgi:hypothetical protein